MLACKHCSTPNSLDSTFCKKCGTAVPADQKREATVQLDKLVDEGLAALNAGRTSEALAIADSAVATDPTHLVALHLKSAVHERRGEIANALESAERIVELNPTSELDRIKRNGLRSSLLDASTPSQPDRRVAFAAAAAAMVLLACGGIILARRPVAQGTVASNTVATGTPIVEKPVVAPPTIAQNAFVQPSTTPTTNPGASDLPTRDPGMSGELPSATRTGERDTNVAPLRPNVDDSLPSVDSSEPPAGSTPTTKSSAAPAASRPVSPRGDGPDPQTIKSPVESKPDNGTIDITVTKSGPRRIGGSQAIPETRTNGAAAYAQVGTERFGLGDYAGAAANLEKAVAGGGDAVGLNLRLAQAYSHLGRSSEAASAYERSRAAADAALKTGKGDKERLQAARDTADAGLRTVKGG